MLKTLLIVLFLLWITPVKAGLLLRAGEDGTQGEIGVMAWGIPLRFSLRRGRRGLEAVFHGRPVALPRPRGKSAAGPAALSLLLPGKASPLRRAVTVREAEIALQIGLRDAAAAALLTGLIRAAAGLLPGIRLRAVPCLGGGWALRARCIAEGRAGMLWTAYALSARRAKEEKAWSIPSAI